MRVEEIIDSILENIENAITKFNCSYVVFEGLDKVVKKIV